MGIDLVANKEKFLTILRGEVHREGIENLIAWLENTDFFEAPATGQYALSCKGGLCESSINTFRAFSELVEKYREQDQNFLLDVAEDASAEEREQAIAELNESVAICGLLSDICRADCWIESTKNVKNGQTGKWDTVPYFKWDEKFVYGHGEKSVYILQQFMRLYIEEAQAIRFHMQGREGLTGNVVDTQYQTLYETSDFAALLGTAVNEASNILNRISWKKYKPE